MSVFSESFNRVVTDLEKSFLTAPVIAAPKWQSTKAPAPMVELFNRSFTLNLNELEDLDEYREVIKPSLPWADRHFEEERVSGQPINPGETWKIWPYANSAAAHLRGDAVVQYDHSYAERYWPRFAGQTPDGRFEKADVLHKRMGIRDEWGDLNDLIEVLKEDPLTRQAYLPIFFPEDLVGAQHNRRVPCTLGYHFICRDMRLHIIYPMRSCDFIRHWRDDIYLTIRLLLWVLDRLREIDPDTWMDVTPGTYRMHMTSLHMFDLDRTNLRHRLRNRP